MKTNICKVIIASVVTVFLVGCSKEPPKCGDESTLKIVRQIILDHTKVNEEFPERLSEKEIKASMPIEYPLPTAYEKEIKKYSCEANLVLDDSSKIPIVYASQLDDKNQHIVSVGGLRENTLSIKNSIKNYVNKNRPPKNKNVQKSEENPIQGMTDWIQYGDDNDGNTWSYNSNLSVNKEGGNYMVTAWAKRSFSDKGREKAIQEMKALGKYAEGFDKLAEERILNEVDCKNKRYKILSVISYDKDGKVLLSEDSKESNWNYVSPNSNGSIFLRKVCPEK